jgi:hypothetical protein
MIEAGILTPEDRVELLENLVVRKAHRTPAHDGTIDLLRAALPGRVPAGWRLRIQQTLVLSDSQPEPDFAIVKGTPRTYLARHPGAADTGLVIEVADSSLLRDRADKTLIYARDGIASFWIIDLVDQHIEVYTQPSGATAMAAYGALHTYHRSDAVPLVLDGNTAGTVPVAELLP